MRPPGLKSRAARFALASAAVAGAFVWFAMGDISEPQGYMSLFRPPAIPRVVELLLASALLAGAISLVAAVRSFHSGTITTLCVASGAAGLFVGFTLRVLSSLTVGANIGGGLLLLAAPFVLLPLGGVAIACWWRVGR